MQYGTFELAVFALSSAGPVIVGFRSSELIRALASGGAAAYLGVLILTLLFEGWGMPSATALQGMFMESAAVVPIAVLFALFGYLAKRLIVGGDPGRRAYR